MAEAVRSTAVDEARALADTERWLMRAVIGLNLCPFAKSVHAKGQVHLATFDGRDDVELMNGLMNAADQLVATDPAERDTTLLVTPNMLSDFFEFNAFVARAERQLARRGFEGVLQLASFHPAYEFAGSDPDDIANATNRSPYPTLHLLREASVERAVEAFPDAEAIFGRNIATLQALGHEGWVALDVGAGAAGS
ncbi:Peptidase [Burkholderiales bacterium 8X]|nr:Peptidase [Burkholderiales bacterium 8X]